jgi:hypothetical protein
VEAIRSNDWFVRQDTVFQDTSSPHVARPSISKKIYSEGTVVNDKKSNNKLKNEEEIHTDKIEPEEDKEPPIPTIIFGIHTGSDLDSLTKSEREDIVTNFIDQWYNNFYNQTLYIGVKAKFIHADFPVLRCGDCNSLVYSNGLCIRHLKKMQQLGIEEEDLYYSDDDDDDPQSLFLPCSANCQGQWSFNWHPVSMPQTFGNHLTFSYVPSEFDRHEFANFSLKDKVNRQYDSLTSAKMFKTGPAQILYKQDFAGLDTSKGIKQLIKQKKEEKDEHKKNHDTLYPEGPPLFKRGHKVLFPKGPRLGQLPPGMRPKHWQLPQCEWYPNGERKYSGFFYEDCPDSNPDYNGDDAGLVDEIDLPDDPFGP